MTDPQQASAPFAAAPAPAQTPVMPPQVNAGQALPPFYCYPAAPENAGYPPVAPVQAPYPYPPQYPQAQAQYPQAQYPQQPAVAPAAPAPAAYPNYPNAAYPAHCHPHHQAYYPPMPPYAPPYPQAAYPQAGQYPYPPQAAPYYAAAQTTAPQHEQGFASFFNFKDEKFLKGAITGAALTFILTNEALQKNTIKSLVKLWNTLQGGIEEVKERFQDAEAEIKAEQHSK